MFETFDQYRDVFENKGFDLRDRNEKTGIPRRIDLRDWLHHGQTQLSEVVRSREVTFRDAIATPDITPWLPQVIERSVLEASEPLLVLTSLFQTVGYEPGQAIEFPAIGAVVAEDVAEGESFPLVRLQESGATVTAKVGKAGIAFELTEEAINRNRFDIVNRHLDACARALARLKEQKCSTMISNLGTVAFDNVNPSSSMFGVTRGRAMNGTANGSLILDDLFDAFAQVMMQGFVPDTLIMHPLSFVMFMKDPVLRAVMLAGGNQVWYGGYSGRAAMTGPGSRTGVSGGQKVTSPLSSVGTSTDGVNAFNTALTSAPVLPNRWPWPLRIVVSPWVSFNPATKMTDLILCDGMELGLLIEEYGPKVDRWDDMAVDSTKFKLKESYCFHILNEGLGIAVLKNVKIIPNEVVFPAQVTHAVSGEIQPIPALTPIS
jgi:hypothetical protein